MTPDASETAAAREAIVRALWEYDEGAGWNMSAETQEEYADRADAVLAALGNAHLTVIDLGDPMSHDDVRALVGMARRVIDQVKADDCGCPETVCHGPLDDPMWCDRDKANRGHSGRQYLTEDGT